MKAPILVRTFGLEQRIVFEHVFADEPRIGDMIEMLAVSADGQAIVGDEASARVARIKDRVWLRDGSLAYLATEEAAQTLPPEAPKP